MDAVKAATIDVPRFYPLGSVPPKPPYPYGVYAAMFGGGDGYTLDSTYSVRNGLVSVQTFGKTSDSASDHMEKVLAALLDVAPDVDGWDTTPLRAGLDQAALNRDPDDNGVLTATMPLTFTATKEA
jgi:hypothetical protein